MRYVLEFVAVIIFLGIVFFLFIHSLIADPKEEQQQPQRRVKKPDKSMLNVGDSVWTSDGRPGHIVSIGDNHYAIALEQSLPPFREHAGDVIHDRREYVKKR